MKNSTNTNGANIKNIPAMLLRYFDKETGTIYLRARYYDPEIGQFTTEDSYWGEDGDPLSLNLYTYCEGDPINFLDPTGHWKEGDENYTVEVQEKLAYYTDMWFIADAAYKKGIIGELDAGIMKGTASSEAARIRYKADHPVKTFFKNVGDAIFEFGCMFIPFDDPQKTGNAESYHANEVLGKIEKSGKFAAVMAAISKKYVVYTLRDPITNEIKYVGRTVNPNTRKINHMMSEDKGRLVFKIEKEGLDYAQARGMEHIMFQKHGGFNKLLNKINPINPKNPRYLKYLGSALDLLKKL